MFILKSLILCVTFFSVTAFAGGTYDDSIIATDKSLDPLEKSMRSSDHQRKSISEDSYVDLSGSSPEETRKVEATVHQINEELARAKAARIEAERMRSEGSLIAKKRSEAHEGVVISTTAKQTIDPNIIMREQISFDSTTPQTIF